MESTASYWKPLFNEFEAHDLNAMVVNAQHMKAVPGRKTDVNDAEWIADLLRHGLLKASYIPEKRQRELREVCQYRNSLVKTRSAEMNRFQKMLEGANIKISGTVSSVFGKSARILIDAMLNDKTIDTKFIQENRDNGSISKHLKASDSELIEDMNGFLTPLLKKMMNELLDHIDELTKHIEVLTDDIDHFMTGEEKGCAELLTEIPGIAKQSAQQIISVIGTDMSRFPTAGHLCAWAGLAPGNNESAGKRYSGKIRKGNKMLKVTLVNSASSAKRNKNSFFSAQFDRLKIHRGKKRATVAVAHSMLIAIYQMLKDKCHFKDLGSAFYDRYNKTKKIQNCLRKLKSLGVDLKYPELTEAVG